MLSDPLAAAEARRDNLPKEKRGAPMTMTTTLVQFRLPLMTQPGRCDDEHVRLRQAFQ